MIRGRCPTCRKSFEAASLADLPAFPFCSERCRLVDLGRWLDDRHGVPAAPPSDPDEPPAPPDDPDAGG